jgi:AraC-like DNA-binding protein
MEHQSEQRVEKFVGVEKPPTLAISAFETAQFTATRVQWSEGGQPTQFDRADGYMVCLQRRDIPAHPYWVDQRPIPLAPLATGQFLLLDLNVQHSSLVPTAVDCISIYTSRDALVQFQAEHGLVANGLLRAPFGAAHEDGAVRHLGEALLPALEQPHLAGQLYADHVALALLARLAGQFGIDQRSAAPMRGGLAGWQERRAKEMLLASLDGSIGLAALAAECRLSRSHFARAFKISTGMSPLRWLTAQRIERVKVLLLSTDLPLEQIAGSCGFADASHLARSFLRATGLPPGGWRRLRRPDRAFDMSTLVQSGALSAMGRPQGLF